MSDDIFSTPSTQSTPTVPMSPPPTPQPVGHTAPEQVQDIFGDTDDPIPASSHVVGSVATTNAYNPYAGSPQTVGNKKTIILITAGVIVLLVIIGVAILIFNIVNTASIPAQAPVSQQPATDQVIPTPTPPTTNTDQGEPTPSSIETTPPPATTQEPAQAPAVNPSMLDSDQDGLTDVEEATNKTNPLLPDTDGDDLTDREELKVYHTEPLNADTDGDGYLDGNEVKNGYDPNGSGKLMVVPQQ